MAPKSAVDGPYKHALSDPLGKWSQFGTTLHNNNNSDATVEVNGCSTLYARFTEGSAYRLAHVMRRYDSSDCIKIQ